MYLYFSILDDQPVNINTSYIEDIHTHFVIIDMTKSGYTEFGLINAYDIAMGKKKDD